MILYSNFKQNSTILDSGCQLMQVGLFNDLKMVVCVSVSGGYVFSSCL